MSTTFTKYYQNPEWKENHLNKMKEKVICECGIVTSRINSYSHKKTKRHMDLMEQIKQKRELARLKSVLEAQHPHSRGKSIKSLIS